MRLRGRKHATAVAVAVLGGLLSAGTPAAVAAPSAPGTPAVTTPDREDGTAPPAVWPRPQSITAAGPAVRLSDEVTLLASDDADPYAVTALRRVLGDAGVRTVSTGPSGKGPVIRFGGSGAAQALRALHAPDRADLPSGGYRIAVGRVAGRDTVAVDGAGEDGLFHAVQTLRQLITDGRVAGVAVRDWPAGGVRGMTEGFYGQPWSQQDRLAQLGFMGRTKQNRYLYAAGDDPYRQDRWRDPYPADRRADFRALAERAAAEHVTLGWAVAPGQSMCLSSDRDLKALTKKIDAMWALGFRVFQVQFQDVSYSEWHCSADADTFGSGPEAAARAQARVVSAVARHLAERHPGAEALSMMPTEFYQDGATDYRTALARELDPGVQVAWTGVGVVPRTITGGELAGARSAFRHPLVTMDNYPVNDYAQDRIFLGPYTGRDPAVATGSAALLANAMEQPSASRIPLFTAADFAWNPKGYRPQESWQAALDDLAGGDARSRDALRALAGNSAGSVLGGDESAYLRPLLDAFWASRRPEGAAGREEAAHRLRGAFTVMRETPQRLAGLAGGRLDDEVRPWSEQLSRYGRAGELAVDLLLAQARGDGGAAWRASLALEPAVRAVKAGGATVGKGVLGPFLDRVREEADAWTGSDRRRGEVTEAPGSYTVRLDRVRPLEAVTAMTEPDGEAPAAGTTVQAHVPGEGWRALGTLSASGWTQASGQGLRVDAVRISWPSASPVIVTPPPLVIPPLAGAAPTAGAVAPAVRALVPWFGDEPVARLDLERDETDAEIGGGPQKVAARLSARRPAEVRGALTAKAPKGITVRLPERTTVPRGSRTEVPVEVTVPAGTPAGSYEVPLSFGAEETTLTVRAFPRTGGPDLLRTATASSSADETPDFPASAATDGDPETRWSSPAEDGSWWQAELPAPARVGRVVLDWQDAYASRYRIQVSADGRTWRTAATVRDGRGGRESVRMDAKDTRFLRVQGDGRATAYGYSLWSVRAYAVTDAP